MRLMTGTLLATMLPFTTSAGEATTLNPTVLAFIDFTKQMFKSGSELFDQLAAGQAASVARDVYSDARSLRQSKTRFKRQLQSGSITQSQAFEAQMQLVNSAQQLGRNLEKFGREIDRVSHLNAGLLLEKIDQLQSSKLDELQQVASVYKQDDPAARDEAAKHLDAAIGELEKMEQAAKCLLDSIETKSKVCDSDLKPITTSGK